MNRTTAQAIKNSGMIPVFYFHDIDSNISVVNACFKGGVRVVEFVNRGDAAMINFPVLKDHVRKYCPADHHAPSP